MGVVMKLGKGLLGHGGMHRAGVGMGMPVNDCM